jgi:general secretion pathway protein G
MTIERSGGSAAGFTIIELLVVMALIALTLTIVAPRYIAQTQRASEAVLRNNLKETRAAIDRYLVDHNGYPASLQQLVDEHYLRSVPFDPIVGKSDAWTLQAPKAGVASGHATSGAPDRKAMAAGATAQTAQSESVVSPNVSAESGLVFDLRSSAPGQATDGSSYASW